MGLYKSADNFSAKKHGSAATQPFSLLHERDIICALSARTCPLAMLA
jgi:hypothetical protein